MTETLRFAISDRAGRLANFVGFMADESSFASGAMARINDVLSAEPDIDLLYADSVIEDADGQRLELRGGWSPERLLTHYDLGPFIIARESCLSGSPARGHHELALRVGAVARRVAHIPEPLSVRRSAPFIDVDADAVGAHLASSNPAIGVDAVGDAGLRLAPSEVDQPFASLVMPTGGATRLIDGAHVLLVANAIASIMVATDRSNFEIVVVVDADAPDALGDLLQSIDPERIVIVKDTRPFNFSAANNLGVQSARGEQLVFINDDCEAHTPGWLRRMAMHLGSPDVGVVGARLLFGDGTVQHAGLVARGGYIEHRFGGYPNDERSRPAPIENVSAVTGACLGITRALFDEIGGFPEEFPLNFNDVHLCFAAAELGRRVVLDHSIVLTHHETSSRVAGITDEEQTAFERRWPQRSQIDPFDHPEFLNVRSQPIAPPMPLLRLRRTLGLPVAAPRLS